MFFFSVIQKGSSMSKYYRFMGKNGEWVWMQTKATIIYNTNNVAQYVVCMNYVVGYVQCNHYLFFIAKQSNYHLLLMESYWWIVKSTVWHAVSTQAWLSVHMQVSKCSRTNHCNVVIAAEAALQWVHIDVLLSINNA